MFLVGDFLIHSGVAKVILVGSVDGVNQQYANPMETCVRR